MMLVFFRVLSTAFMFFVFLDVLDFHSLGVRETGAGAI
jgi:hypothetical protein